MALDQPVPGLRCDAPEGLDQQNADVGDNQPPEPVCRRIGDQFSYPDCPSLETTIWILNGAKNSRGW
jgi:hypothetical protein